MKKMKLNFGSEKMLSKDQMKTIKGGDLERYTCMCLFNDAGMNLVALNCNSALQTFLFFGPQCDGGYAKCYEMGSIEVCAMN